MRAALGLCECGCGQSTRIAERDRPDLGWRRGEPIPCIQGHQGRLANRPYVDADAQAIAYYTGAADARNRRPRRVDPADRSPNRGQPYHRGYNDHTVMAAVS